MAAVAAAVLGRGGGSGRRLIGCGLRVVLSWTQRAPHPLAAVLHGSA
jgi:hypothetical protein